MADEFGKKERPQFPFFFIKMRVKYQKLLDMKEFNWVFERKKKTIEGLWGVKIGEKKRFKMKNKN